MKVLKFQADWCQPCKTLSKTMENIIPLFPNIDFVSVNVDEQPEMVATYNIRNIPTLLLLKEGQEVLRRAGCPTEEELKEFCQYA